MQVKGVKQEDIRERNLKIVLDKLRDDKLSITDLAKLLNLSKPAVSNILSEMLEQSIIVECPIKNGKKTNFQINNKVGISAIVSFGSTYIKIVIIDVSGNKLFQHIIEDCEFVEKVHLEEVVTIINNYVESSCHSTILSLVVSVAAKVNFNTEEYIKSVKFKELKDFSIKNYFKETICEETHIFNDINLYMLGEDFVNPKTTGGNFILIHIDSGIGGAIMINNEAFVGENGYAGEFGLTKTFDSFGNIRFLADVASTNAIKATIGYRKLIGEKTLLADKFKLKDVVSAYKQEDSMVTEIVLGTAKNISIIIDNLSNSLDIKTFLISGRIRLFGEKYLNEVKKYVSEHVDVYFTDLDDEAIEIGASKAVLEHAFNFLLSERKRSKNEKK